MFCFASLVVLVISQFILEAPWKYLEVPKAQWCDSCHILSGLEQIIANSSLDSTVVPKLRAGELWKPAMDQKNPPPNTMYGFVALMGAMANGPLDQASQQVWEHLV